VGVARFGVTQAASTAQPPQTPRRATRARPAAPRRSAHRRAVQQSMVTGPLCGSLGWAQNHAFRRSNMVISLPDVGATVGHNGRCVHFPRCRLLERFGARDRHCQCTTCIATAIQALQASPRRRLHCLTSATFPNLRHKRQAAAAVVDAWAAAKTRGASKFERRAYERNAAARPDAHDLPRS